MGSLLDQGRSFSNKKCELEKVSNTSSEFVQQMYGEDELAKDMGIFDAKKGTLSVGSMSSQGKMKPLIRASSPVARRDSLDENDLPETNLDVRRASSLEMKNGRSSADKILYHTQESPILNQSDLDEKVGTKRKAEEELPSEGTKK